MCGERVRDIERSSLLVFELLERGLLKAYSSRDKLAATREEMDGAQEAQPSMDRHPLPPRVLRGECSEYSVQH